MKSGSGEAVDDLKQMRLQRAVARGTSKPSMRVDRKKFVARCGHRRVLVHSWAEPAMLWCRKAIWCSNEHVGRRPEKIVMSSSCEAQREWDENPTGGNGHESVKLKC